MRCCWRSLGGWGCATWRAPRRCARRGIAWRRTSTCTPPAAVAAACCHTCPRSCIDARVLPPRWRRLYEEIEHDSGAATASSTQQQQQPLRYWLCRYRAAVRRWRCHCSASFEAGDGGGAAASDAEAAAGCLGYDEQLLSAPYSIGGPVPAMPTPQHDDYRRLLREQHERLAELNACHLAFYSDSNRAYFLWLTRELLHVTHCSKAVGLRASRFEDLIAAQQQQQQQQQPSSSSSPASRGPIDYSNSFLVTDRPLRDDQIASGISKLVCVTQATPSGMLRTDARQACEGLCYVTARPGTPEFARACAEATVIAWELARAHRVCFRACLAYRDPVAVDWREPLRSGAVRLGMRRAELERVYVDLHWNPAAVLWQLNLLLTHMQLGGRSSGTLPVPDVRLVRVGRIGAAVGEWRYYFLQPPKPASDTALAGECRLERLTNVAWSFGSSVLLHTYDSELVSLCGAVAELLVEQVEQLVHDTRQPSPDGCVAACGQRGPIAEGWEYSVTWAPRSGCLLTTDDDEDGIDGNDDVADDDDGEVERRPTVSCTVTYQYHIQRSLQFSTVQVSTKLHLWRTKRLAARGNTRSASDGGGAV